MPTSYIRTSSREAVNTDALSRNGASNGERVRLHDARKVTIRPILPSDLDALRTFFVVLSRATLRLRFHFSVQELSDYFLHKFTVIDHRDHVAFVAEALAGAVDNFVRSLSARAPAQTLGAGVVRLCRDVNPTL